MKQRMIRTASNAFAAMLLTVGALAQSPLDAARLLEEAEFNPGAAALAYEKIAKDPAAKDEDRTEALLRKGLCLTRLDRTEDARAAFAAAAKGQGPAATTAAEYLDGRLGAQDEDVARRVKRAIANLAQDGNVADTALKELRLIGQRAIPSLIEAVERSDNESTDVFTCVRLVIEIGGDKSIEFLRRVVSSSDDLLRRTVVQAYTDQKQLVNSERGGYELPAAQRSQPAAGILRRFLEDADPTIRSRAFNYYARVNDALTIDEVRAALDDPSDEVRERALTWLGHYGIETSIRTQAAWQTVIVPRLIELLDDARRDLAQRAFDVAVQPRTLQTSAGFDLFIAALCDEKSTLSDKAAQAFEGSIPAAPPTTVPAFFVVIDARRMMAAMEQLGSASRSLQSSERSNRWLAFSKVLGYSMSTWTSAEVKTAVIGGAAIVREIDESKVILKTIYPRVSRRPVDAEFKDRALADALFRIDPGIEFVLDIYRGLGTGADDISGFYEYVEGYIAELESGTVNPNASRCHLLTTILTVRPGAKDHGLLQRAAKTDMARQFLSVIAQRVGTEGYPMDVAVTCARAPSSSQLAPYERSRLLSWFWVEGVEAAIELFGEFYASPLSSVQFPANDRYGITSSSRGLDTDLPTKYSDDQIARIIRSALAGQGKNAQATEDVSKFLARRNGRPSVVIAQAVVDGFLGLAEDVREKSTDVIRSLDPVEPLVVELFHRILTEAPSISVLGTIVGWDSIPAKLVPEIRRALSTTNQVLVLERATRALLKASDSELPSLLRTVMASPNAHLRKAAMELLVEIRAEGVVDDVRRGLNDPAMAIRQTAGTLAAAVVDSRLVPDLVKALKDPESVVREEAKEALDAITYYYEQESRWKRLAEGTGLESTSAAESLLKKADPSQKKEVRLLAISSLGTLGVAETLPMLIGMAEESDAEIAAAARAAIEKINAGTKR